MQPREFLKRMWVLMATIFVDMMGFFIILPLLPYYAEDLGADPFMVGSLVSAFAIAQLASAPLWGRLSDRYGRRPMILSGLVISALAYVLFESADTVWLLFLSRFVQGFGAGTVGVVQAYLSDSVPAKDRSKAFGWLTAATSAGVMLGPVLGSLAAGMGVIGPGYLAASLCALNFVFCIFWLKEPEVQEGAERKKVQPGAMRRAIADILRRPRGAVGSVVWVYAFGMMAFMAVNGVLALYLERRFGIDETTIGWFFTYVGGVSLLMRTLALGPAVRHLGEVRAMRVGALSVALGLATIPLGRSIPELALAVLFIPVGTALLFPTTTSLVSHRAAAGQTGLMLGVQQLFGGVSRMLGPIWAGAAFQHFGVASPFWIAGALMLAVSLFAASVKTEAGPAEPRLDVVLPADS